MLAFRTTRCPYCGAKIEIMEPYGINDYGNDLGEPYGLCSSCGGKFTTGKQRWSRMNILVKIMVILKLIFNIIVSSALFSALILFCIYGLKKYFFKDSFNWLDNYEVFDLILIGAVILIPILAIGGVLRLKEEIKEFQ